MPAFPAFPYFTGNGSAGGWGRPSCCLRAAGRFCSPAAWGTLRGCVPFPVNYSAVFPKSSMKVGIASEDRIGLDNRDGKTKAAGPSGRTSPGRDPRCQPCLRRGIDRRLAGRPHGGTDRPREQARLLEDRRLPLGKDPPVRIRGGGGAFPARPLRFGRVASRIRGDAEGSRSTGSRPPAGVPSQRRADARTLPPRDDLTRGPQWIPWGPPAAGGPLA